ncbi:metalloprotease [Candidatus Woesearchaeota archaeon]|nr:metalloprotease [Candidatus Woesearchaeota archaeon]
MQMDIHEAKELLKAWAVTALAFGILIWTRENTLLFSVVMAAFTVGLGFILHELAHKGVANAFGKRSEFRANNRMLILMILMSFLGFIFAAPGAVWTHGMVSKRQNGMIAAAGPLANILLAALFIPLVFIMPKIAYYGVMINALLGLFNLIPIPGFDGVSVVEWSKTAYISLAALAVFMMMMSIALPNFVAIG